MRRLLVHAGWTILGALALLAAGPWGARAAPLELEAKIPLGSVVGRIDHLAVDSRRGRLFVAELGNDSVAVLDLGSHALHERMTGFVRPQGIAYDAATDSLFVANAGDSSLRVLRGADLSPAGRVEVGDDADNVRVDPKEGRVYVGHGGGAIAIVDPRVPSKIGDVALEAHPEGFQLDPASGRIYVNVPEARQVAVLDRTKRTQVAAWPLPDASANFPLAIDPTWQRVLVVSRRPSRLIAFDPRGGGVVAEEPTCGDADDLFVDVERRRIYVACGEGFVDVYENRSDGYGRLAHIPTVPGARTALFVPTLERLFLAVRARAGEAAAIWVFRARP